MPVRRADSVNADPVRAGKDTEMQVLIAPGEGTTFAMRRFRMQPGGGMPRHTNAVEHQQYVLGGRARVGIGEEVHEVSRDHVLFIPAGVPHWYEAQGEEPFEFLCLVPDRLDTMVIVDDSKA